MKVTLVIATLNRSGFLARLLDYYRDTGFAGCILIGDSSSVEHQDRTKAHIGRLRSDLNIRYVDLPEMGSTAAYEALARMVETPYAALLGDDDFLVPSGLARCADFLDNHAGYASVAGKGLMFRSVGGGIGGDIESLVNYRTPDLTDDSSSQRLLRHLRDYRVTLFSVHRTETWRTMWSEVSCINERSIGSELLPSCLSAVLGKAKQLDGLYLIRQGHDQRYLEVEIFDRISSENWRPSYLEFKERLTHSLAEQDGISHEEADEAVKQAFWWYLSQHMQRHWSARYDAKTTGLGWRSRQLVGQIPPLQRAWRELHSRLPGENNRMSLKALLRPGSPYHDDFMPVYRAITASSSE